MQSGNLVTAATDRERRATTEKLTLLDEFTNFCATEKGVLVVDQITQLYGQE